MHGTIALPFGTGRTSPVAVDDVARVVLVGVGDVVQVADADTVQLQPAHLAPINARLLIFGLLCSDTDPVGAVAERGDPGDRPPGGLARHQDPVAAIVPGPHLGQRGVAVAAQQIP